MKFRKKPVVIEAEQFFTDNGTLWPEGVKTFSLLCLFYYSLFSWFLLCLLSFFKNEICWRLILLVYKKLLYLSVLFTVYKTKSDVNVFYHTFVGLCSPFFF